MIEPAAPPFAPERPVAQIIEPRTGDGWPESGLGPVEEILPFLPDPSELAPGTWIAVGPGAPEPRRFLSRLFGQSAAKARIHLAVRCTALLVRGYTSICADRAGIAFGRAPG